MITGIDMMIEWLRRKDEKERDKSFAEPFVLTHDALFMAEHLKRNEKNAVIKYLTILQDQISIGKFVTMSEVSDEIERLKSIVGD